MERNITSNCSLRLNAFFKVCSYFSAIFFCLPVLALADTYYIDYQNGSDTYDGMSIYTPWKKCPGMSGFSASYSHSPGDIFIFKGGVNYSTLTIRYSGTAGKVDVYTVDKSWFSGSEWTQPVFDGEGLIADYSGIIDGSNQSYIKIDNLKIQNVGKSGQISQGRALLFNYAYNIEIANCTIIPYANHAIVGAASGTESNSGLHIHHNDISHATNMIEFRSDAKDGSQPFYNLSIHDNSFHDPHTQLIGGDHGDGIHLFSVGNYKQIKDLKIYNNYWYGDYSSLDSATGNTAQIYIEDCADGFEIYNNILSFSSKSTNYKNGYMFSPGMISIYGSTNGLIYNNTISGDAANTASDTASSGIQINSSSSNISIKNNIVSMTKVGIAVETTTGMDINNNLIIPRSDWVCFGKAGGTFKYDLDSWKSVSFVGNGELSGDPKFNSIPYNFQLTSGSAAIDTGFAISDSSYNTDIDGNSRPSGAGWDIGAYEYTGSYTAIIEPTTPTSLRIVN